MADIFVSYARVDKARVTPLVAALEAQGWSVWWDPEITPGQEFDSLITNELKQTRAVIVVWTPASVVSRWVRGEARVGADRGILIPVRFDNAELPIDARAVHTTDLDDWRGDVKSAVFEQLVRAIGALLKQAGAAHAPSHPSAAAQERHAVSICVLPFTNMSGDAEQEYFSDGISEDIITDLSKVSALHVVARNTAFTFKGKAVDIKEIARQINVRYVLEGSVRKSGNRVRITGQLIDGETGNHLWAERYDRDLADIFAMQDEISQAIVTALKVRLLPEEKKSLAKRATTSAEAYELFLMARQYSVKQGERYVFIIEDLLSRAVEIDPNYAAAWARLAIAQMRLRREGHEAGDPQVSLKRALELDPNSAEAHGTTARILTNQRRFEEAEREIRLALDLDPESYEVCNTAGEIAILTDQREWAIALFEKSARLAESDFSSLVVVAQLHGELGNKEAMKAAAQRGLQRAETEMVRDPVNGDAFAAGAALSAMLGEATKAKDFARRAMLVDSGNLTMRYNLACSLLKIGERETALQYLEIYFANVVEPHMIAWASGDGDLNSVRDDPRFKTAIASAEQRLAKLAADAAAKASNGSVP
jgi:adenylate cyclase